MSEPDLGFSDWLDLFLKEKEIDADEILLVQGPRGLNHIPVECLADAMKGASARDQAGVRRLLVDVDRRNADVRAALRHLAGAIAL